MKLIDKIAYGNAIELLEAHIVLCGYRETKAFRKMLDRSNNRILKTTFMQENAKDMFNRFRWTILRKRYIHEMPYDFNGTSPVAYVTEQLISRVWTAITIRRCKKEISG